MTFVEQAQEIVSGVTQAAQRELVVEKVAQLKRLESSLDQLILSATELMSIVHAARNSGLDINTDALLPFVQQLPQAAERVKEGQIDPSEISQLITDVHTELPSIQNAITISWGRLIDLRLPQRDGLERLADTYLQLDRDNALADTLKKVVELAQQLPKMGPSDETVTILDGLAIRVPQLLRDLVGEDESVRSFAERVARGGAPLEALTPEVNQWIASKGFERSFKVVLGEPEL